MGNTDERDVKKTGQWRIEDQEWWKKYSAMIQSHEIESVRNMEFPVDFTASVTSGIRYYGSGSGSLGFRYVGSGSGSLGIRYIGSGSGSLGIRYIGSGSGSLGFRYVGSGSGSLRPRYFGSVPERKVPEEEYQNPYVIYDRSQFPGESSGSENGEGILGYGLDLI